MLITFFTYLPILAAPAAALALVVLLQRCVKPRRLASATVTSTTRTALVPATSPDPPKPTWDDIATHTNPLVAYLLPILAAAAIVLLVLWPLAYLGWAIIRLDADPGWAAQAPPWFGNLGYFLGFGAAGVMIAFTGTILIVALALGLHAIGKCILWPEVCGCDDAESPEHASDPNKP